MMNIRRRIAFCLLLAMLCQLLNACLSSRSIDEYGYALVIGVDQGKSNQFYVSMLIQRSNGNMEGAQEEVSPLIAVECADLFEAVDLLESSLPFALNLSRTTAIVFGSELAKGTNIKKFLTASLGSLQIRYYANLMIAHQSAEDFLRGIQSKMSPNLAKLQYNFVELSNTTGFIPSITLAQFYDRAWSGAGDVLLPLGAYEAHIGESDAENGKDENEQETKKPPQIPPVDMLGEVSLLPGALRRRGGLSASLIGSAVFRGTSMVGYMNGEHTQYILMAINQFEKGSIMFPLPGEVSVNVLLSKSAKPKNTLFLSETPVVYFHLYLNAAIEEPQMLGDIGADEIKNMLGDFLENRLQEVFLACRKSGADVFEIGKLVAMQFKNTEQWERYDWESAYAVTEAVFDVEIKMEYNPGYSRME